MEELLGFIVNCVLWYLFFKLCFKLYEAWNAVKSMEDPERKEMVKKVMSMIHTIKQEQHGDLFYWFDADTDMFLGQGKTDEEIKQHLKERFKGHVFLLDDDRALAGPDLVLTPIKDLKLQDKGIA